MHELGDISGSEKMDIDKAKKIINYVVERTKPRWQQYDEYWDKIDEVFIRRGYEQGGFEAWKFAMLLRNEDIFSIGKIGLILDKYRGNTKYDRGSAGSLKGSFYQDMMNGVYGEEGEKFYKCVDNFGGKAGAWFWNKLWQMLVCCNHLKNKYEGSFSYFLKKKYAEFKKTPMPSDDDFLKISFEDLEEFKKDVKPWEELYGIGENVFDFIIGDIKEAKFVENSYKLDSANIYFLRITGIYKLLHNNLKRENVVNFLKQLDLRYTLREINKGVYTYCSKTESDNFGFCHDKEKCSECEVNDICEKNFNQRETSPNTA